MCVLWYTTQLWYAFHNSQSAFVFTFSSFLEVVFLLFIWLFINLVMRKQTRGSWITTRFCVIKIGTRADANIHKAFACKYLSNNIYTVVEGWTHGYFCLGYFSSSTHFHLVKGLARKVWRQCVLVSAHGLGYRGGNCNGLLANTGLFLSTGNRYLFLLQRPLIPFDSWPLLLTQFSRV